MYTGESESTSSCLDRAVLSGQSTCCTCCTYCTYLFAETLPRIRFGESTKGSCTRIADWCSRPSFGTLGMNFCRTIPHNTASVFQSAPTGSWHRRIRIKGGLKDARDAPLSPSPTLASTHRVRSLCSAPILGHRCTAQIDSHHVAAKYPKIARQWREAERDRRGRRGQYERVGQD